jgi:hypothetical protein
MMLLYSKLLCFLLLSSLALAQNLTGTYQIWSTPILIDSVSSKENTLTIGQNFKIYPSNVSQTEVFIVTHPSNPEIMFVACNTIIFNPFFVSEGCYATTNGGNSWYGSDTCKGAPINLHGGDPGITINKNGTFILTRRGFSPGLYSHYSTDFGVTWSNQKTITNDDLERATMTSDVHPSSPYFGRSYAAWVKFAPPFPLNFSFTNDGGVSWSTTAQINNPIQRSAGGDITMGPNGKVYVCWAGVTSVSPFTEDFVGVASSTNGGTNWQVTENAFDMNGINGILTQKGNIRVNGLPNIAIDTTGGPRNGWIYIVTTQKNLSPAGSDPDVILNRSTDGGQTWSARIRVNQDPVNNGKIQYFPAVHVDKTGGLNVIFYDDRNTTSDSSGVFLARSEDGGNNWREFEISDRNFKPLPIGGLGQGYQGDNISITSSNNKLWPVWMDNRQIINPPTILTAEADTFSVLLTWSDNSNNELGFIIERKEGAISSGNTFIVIDTTERNITTYQDKNLMPVTTYTYRLQAFNSDIVSQYSNLLEAKTIGGYSYELQQNYPNPFSKTTIIKFDLEISCLALLEVFDILGNQVSTLVNQELSAGNFEVNFNPYNLSSGIYFYRLRAGSFTDTKKMILLR